MNINVNQYPLNKPKHDKIKAIKGSVTMEYIEKCELTTLCLVYDEDKILVQNRLKEDWKGIVLPRRLFFCFFTAVSADAFDQHLHVF